MANKRTVELMTRKRKRLELSREQCGAQLNVTGATIRNWEIGETKPRGNDLIALMLWLSAEERVKA